ncbi:deoxyribodipyrimidine photolyase [Zhengella mangrovi]|uniref:Deoxyribodipyrimidine photo-lyase n=1 Tax=Zhengella mangrovi TaxID=1982044 RepID=A0A2G1QS85_9HYPH|nr:deoxyribodipyrimidine photo-lyase [Zhengella mangrovi]PHP68396.1 deoxyribodipyrimidine photolyase [Zhengella mangrovi]
MTFKHDTDPAKPVLVLFRHDLRVAGNAALTAAAGSGKPVIPVFVRETGGPRFRAPGAAWLWWLHHSIAALSKSLESLGANLVLRSGRQRDIMESLIEETGADMVLWNRRYDPAGMEADTDIKAALKDRDLHAESFSGALLHEPWQLKTGSGGYYKVYSPFWRAFSADFTLQAPPPAPRSLRAYDGPVTSEALDDWRLLPTRPDWAGGLREAWTPGEAEAHRLLEAFLDGAIDGYRDERDRPDIESTSRLSPYLAHGEISPAQIFQAIADRETIDAREKDIEHFRKEVGWREFSYHLLFHNPDLATKNFNSDFDAFPWGPIGDRLEKWQKGETGYPIVDAGMRQLWETGWMHNRVRMAAASFLIKHLRVHWHHGEAWFWDTLVDADPANNAASWQWVAGSGADAAPYFRIFNPILQGEKFDTEGNYVRRFVPALKDMPADRIHKPWQASKSVLDKAGVTLGKTYPEPLVDHQQARDSALEAYKTMRGEA